MELKVCGENLVKEIISTDLKRNAANAHKQLI